MKLNWTSIAINNSFNQYEIKSLKSCTNYMVKASSKNMNGWGIFSKSVQFKTKEEEEKFDSKHCSNKINLSNNNKTITKNIDDGVTSSFGINMNVEWC